jgi:hypothetical protein
MREHWQLEKATRTPENARFRARVACIDFENAVKVLSSPTMIEIRNLLIKSGVISRALIAPKLKGGSSEYLRVSSAFRSTQLYFPLNCRILHESIFDAG